jgi:Pyruvate/2-oxoacid:ferredoxin oxidoreductase delta subunit
MAKRKIIKIDAEKCNGCALCIPNCPEGALQIIDGKARLISDLFCDGLGACIGNCQGAITIEEREAQKYDEKKVMVNIVTQGENVIRAHLKHLKEHKADAYLQEALDYLKENKIKVNLKDFSPAAEGKAPCGCPGAKLMDFKKESKAPSAGESYTKSESQLSQWPVQIMLLPPSAPFFEGADLLIAADCVPFAYADFHRDLLKGKVLLVGCPKLDDIKIYAEKLNQVLQYNNVKSVTYAHMEVPCCSGLISVIKSAIAQSGKEIPFKEITISIKGERR